MLYIRSEAVFLFFPFIGPHLSSWLQADLFVKCPQEHLHKKCSIRGKPVGFFLFFFFFFGGICIQLELLSLGEETH